MSTDEKSAGEAEEPTEGEGEQEGEDTEQGESPSEDQQPSTDPLDAIEDETERNEQKRIRAIYRRNKDSFDGEKKEEKPETHVPSDVASKEDLQKLVTADAKRLVSDEVLEHWDELTAIPLGGYDAYDASSIAQNMADRLELWKKRNPAKGTDPAKEMRESTGVRGRSPSQRGKEEKPEDKLPGYKEASQPDEWYPDPNA